MKYQLTRHAREVMEERGIPLEWMERALFDPGLVSPDPGCPKLERRFAQIPEFNGRVLRVVVDTSIDPVKVVSVFFDRQMRGQL